MKDRLVYDHEVVQRWDAEVDHVKPLAITAATVTATTPPPTVKSGAEVDVRVSLDFSMKP